MMKNFILILLAAVLTLAGCSKEPGQEPSGETPKNMVAFTYKSYRSTESRATVPASDAERVVRDLDIFAFSGGQFLAQLTSGNGYNETTSGDYSTITLSQEFIGTHTGKTVVFYFVANNAASLAGSTNNTGKHIASFTGTLADFENLLTSPLGLSPYYNQEPDKRSEILAIDPAAGGMLMTGKTAEIKLIGKHEIAVTLKRRMARFDIVNPAPDNFHISYIAISAAPVQGNIFADGTPATPALRAIEEIGPVGRSAYNAQNCAEAVFYLYPTNLSATQIVISGWFDDPQDMHLFILGSNIDIVANQRYTLLFDENDLKVVAGVGDWD